MQDLQIIGYISTQGSVRQTMQVVRPKPGNMMSYRPWRSAAKDLGDHVGMGDLFYACNNRSARER